MAYQFTTNHSTFTTYHHTGSGTLILTGGVVVGPGKWIVIHDSGVTEVLSTAEFEAIYEEAE
jgi:hypothetical protein